MKKYITNLLVILGMVGTFTMAGISGCAVTENTTAYDTEEIQQLETTKEKALALSTNGWQLVGSASSTLTRLYKSGFFNREEAVKRAQIIDKAASGLAAADLLIESGDYSGGIDAALAQQIILEALIQAMIELEAEGRI